MVGRRQKWCPAARFLPIFGFHAGPFATGVRVCGISWPRIHAEKQNFDSARSWELAARSENMADFLQIAKERVVVYDGAMGTNIQKRNPTLDDFWGKENCSEVLVLSRPDIIREIHADFFRAGCDIVETNTFGGMSIVLSEFDLRDRVREINVAAAKLAKDIANQFSTKDKPR